MKKHLSLGKLLIQRIKYEAKGFYQIGPLVGVFIFFSLLVLPAFLLNYEFRIYDIQKEQVLSCVDVAMYNTYTEIPTKKTSRHSFEVSQESLEAIFTNALAVASENRGNLIEKLQLEVAHFEYEGETAVFDIEVVYVYVPLCLKFLPEKDIVIALKYEIPTNK